MATPKRIYIGPPHGDKALVTREGQRVKPSTFTTEEHAAFTKRYPHYREWWVIEEPAKTTSKKAKAKTDEV